MAVFTGTFAGDIFTVAAGDNRYDALGGNDIAVFDFRLTDAVVSYAGSQVIVDTATSHTVLTGFQTYRFTDGTVEENDGNPLVADLFYYANNHDVWTARVDADNHFASSGWREGRAPNAFFDTNYYLASNPDVAQSGVNPLVHYDLFGWQEGRLPSLAFDQQSYLINNPGLAASGIDPLAHFLRFGGEAGTGNATTLVSTAVNAAGFDATFYLLNNPDVRASGVDPYQHFQAFGWKEGRNPNAFFDTKGYLATYTDVKNSGANPLDHYNTFGWHEGRNPSPGFDTTSYLDANPDVKASGVNPLIHYLTFGVNEGRAAIPQDIADAKGAIMEGATSGSNVGIKASWGNWFGVSFAITADTSGGAFVVDTSTGAVTIANGALLDYDHGAREHTITVQATVGALSRTRTFTITLTDDPTDNQAGPVLVPVDANGAPNTVAENAAIGTAVGVTALALDPDATDTVTYSLDNDAGGRFAIDANTGVVTVAGALDFETAASHAILVRATSTDGSSVTQAFSVGVTNVNDTAPVITSTAGASVAENTIAVLNLTAADADGPAATFAIVGGADASLFTIVGNQLRFIAPRNFEAPADAGANNVYDVQVQASDGINVSAIQSIAVTVTNVNEAPAGADGAVTTAEDTAYVLKTTDFAFGDPDAAASLAAVRITALPGAGTLTLNNVAVTLNQDIAVAQIAAGLLVFTPAANANGASYAQIGFAVSDGALLDPTSNTLTINVTAVNDAPVAVNDILGATEDQAGALAVNLLANDTDLDGPASAVTSFALVTGGAGSASAPGTIALANGAQLSVDAAGNVTLTQNNAYDHLNAGETAQIVFNYQMTDTGNPAHTATAQAVITVTGTNDQVDLDLNFGVAGDDRDLGPVDNVTPAQLMFGVAATEITDAEDKLSSVSITITAPQGGSVNAGEALGIAPDTLALVSSLLGFTVEVSGNGGQSLTISAPSGQFFTAQALETLLENVTYAINQSDFSFNASDRALSVTVTDFSTGATSDTALLTLDMRADVTATAGQNAFTGGNLSDLARGGAGDDVIAGDAGDDALVGGADNDTLTGGGGNDTIIGNDATVVRIGASFNVGAITGAAPNAGESDTAIYSGASSEYVVTRDPSGSYTVADQVDGRDGTDTLWGIETVDFAGGASLQLAGAIKVFDASGSVLLATYGVDQLDQAVAFANGAGGANIIELDAAAGSFSAGAWPVVISDAVTIKAVNGAPAAINAGANSAFVISESAVNLAGEVVRLEGLSINGTGAANTVGIEFTGTYGGSSDGAIEVIGTSVSNFGRVGLLVNGGGNGLSVSVGDDASTLAAETATFSGSGGANPLDGGTGDILFFEFTGDALLRNVAVTGNSATADNGIQISGFQDGVGSANNVLTEIGNVRLENVSVNGTYQKNLVYIQGYNDLTALDFANVNLGTLTGTAAGWAALFIDGAPQGGAYVANGAADGSIDGTLDLTGVTVIGGIFGTTPNFVALGSKQIVVNGTLTDDSIIGTSAHEAFFGLAGNDVIATGGGNDLVLYNVGDGQDTVTDNGGFDTLGLINVDATLAPSDTAASWTITNTGTTLSVDTDAAGTIDEVAATGFEALAVQLGGGGDTVTLDGNLGAGGAGLFAITINGGLAGADGADIVDARTLSSATGIVFNGGAGSDRFVSSNASGTDTFNGGADGVTGDTVDYSAVTGSGVTVNLSGSGVNSTGAGNDTLINVENVIGTNQADTFTGSSDNNMFDGRGGAAVDQVIGYTGPGWQIRINAASHWVVENSSGQVDELIDIEKVVINGTTYLLVDQMSDGGFASVQAAIDAASGGEVILIAPGAYVESKVPAPHSLSAGGLFIDKPNLTLQGVRANGTPIDTAANARDFGATIVSGAQTDFGANHLVGSAASNATIQGLHLKAGAATDNKLLEIWADGFQVVNSFVDTTRAGGVATTAVTIYINEVAGTQIDDYRIEGNILNKGIYVANGTGDAPGTISPAQIIRGNTFTGDGSYDGSTDRLDAISVRGEEPGIGWQTQPAQVPLIEDNHVTDNSAPFLFRMREKNPGLFPSAAAVAAIVDGNFSAGTTWAYVLDGSDPAKVRLAQRDHDGPGGVDSFYQFAVANSINTHNLGLDPASDPVFGTLVVPSMQAGDIVRVNSGAGTSDQSLLVNDLTIKATATSADLNLTLGGGVAEVTLADYAPGLGANVDVTANAAGNIVTGNSGANTITTLGGNDVIDAGGGADIVNAGEGDDIINYTAGDGADAVDGGEGAETVGDTLNVTGSDGNDYIRVSPTLDGDANLDIDLDLGLVEDPLSAIELDVVNVEEIVINTGAGNDTVVVSGDLGGTGVSQSTVRVSGGAGDDTLTVSGVAPVRVAAVYADGPEGYHVTVAADGTVTVQDLDDDGDLGTAGDGIHEGADTLAGVATIEFDGAVLDLTKAVWLCDGHDHLVATFGTLQEAVNAVGEANSTIRIVGGTQLQEQVVINGTLALDAARFAGLSIVGMSAGAPTLDGSNSGVVIKAPTDVVGTALDPWNAGVGTRAINAIVTVIGVADVSIENLTIDGDGRAATGNAQVGATATAVFDYVGIAYVNSSGAIDHVTVQEVRDGPLNGVQRGQAIYATNAAANDDKTFAVIDSLVTDFQKTGILVRNMDVTLTGNTVTGAGATGLIAQNGIQVSQDSTGDITGNVISGMGYTGAANASSSGMYLWNSAGLTVTGNSITGVGMGATNGGGSGSSVGIIVDGVDGSTITGNQLHDAFYGVWEFNGINPENNVDLNSYDDVAVNHTLAPTGSLTNAFTPAGTDGVDSYAGAAGDDVLTGGGGDDTLHGGGGDDDLQGGSQAVADTATYDDARANYTLTTTTDLSGFVTAFSEVAETSGFGVVDEGDDTLGGIEVLQFSGTVLDLNDPVQLFSGTTLLGTFDDLKDAVDAANARLDDNFIIRLKSGDVQLGGQVVINKNIAIEGAGEDVTILHADVSTAGNHNDNSGALIVVNAGKAGDFSDLTIDGTGRQVAIAIRHFGTGTVEDVHFANIKHSTYLGTGISVRGSGDVDVLNSNFTNIERIGAHFRDADVIGKFEGNTYTGKGSGVPAVDYAAEAGGGASVQFTNNTVSNNSGLAGDGSTSAGFLVSDFFGPGTEVTFSGNTVSASTVGVAAGFLDTDASSLTFLSGNDFSGAATGVTVTGNVTANGTNLVDGTFDWDGGPANNAPSGAGLADTLHGNDGFDTFTGFGGSDAIEGGEGGETYTGAAGEGDTAVYTTVLDAGDITLSGGGWQIDATAGGEGTDTLTGVEIVDGGGAGKFLLVGNGGYATIAAALAEASSGDTIILASGTYAGNLTIDRAVTILGANHGANAAGPRQAESVIDGQWQISTGSKVVIDGVKFLDDAPVTSDPADNFVALRINVHGDHEVLNSIFARETIESNKMVFSGLASTQTHRAIELASVPAGETVHIVDNLFTSDNHAYWYGGDNWRTAIYSNGGPGATTIDGNKFEYVRSAINADDFTDTVTISDNTFRDAGTGISVGGASGGLNVDVSPITKITGNTFDAVDTDFSFQNITAAGNNLDWTMTASGNATLSETDALLVLGSANADTIIGTAGREILVGNGGADRIDGQGGNDVLVGGLGDDRLTGGGGFDTLTGGAGDDTFVFLSTAEAGTGFDTLEDFTAGFDKIEISKAGFQGLSGFATGMLSDDNFAFRQVDGSGTYSDGTSAPVFLVDKVSAGAPSLWYDDNGNGVGAVKIAEFDPTTNLSLLDHQDFWLV